MRKSVNTFMSVEKFADGKFTMRRRDSSTKSFVSLPIDEVKKSLDKSKDRDVSSITLNQSKMTTFYNSRLGFGQRDESDGDRADF